MGGSGNNHYEAEHKEEEKNAEKSKEELFQEALKKVDAEVSNLILKPAAPTSDIMKSLINLIQQNKENPTILGASFEIIKYFRDDLGFKLRIIL